MKKIIIFLLSITNLALFAQEKSFDLGVNAGFGTSFLYKNWFPNYNPKPNFTYSALAGFSFVYSTPKMFTLMTDLNYENKGYSSKVILTDDLGNTTEEKTVRFLLHTTSISIMPGFITKGKTNFFLYSGPSFYSVFNERFVNGRIQVGASFNLGFDLKFGIQKQLTERIKLNVFFQERLDVYNKSNFLKNSMLLGTGVYYNLVKNTK